MKFLRETGWNCCDRFLSLERYRDRYFDDSGLLLLNSIRFRIASSMILIFSSMGIPSGVQGDGYM